MSTAQSLPSSLAAITCFGLALHGWGVACQLSLGTRRHLHWSVTIVLGLAGIIFAGGILNFAGLASIASLNALLFGGISLSVIPVWKAIANSDFRFVQSTPGRAVSRYWPIGVYAIIAIVLIFLIVTQRSPSAYNFHDDFEKYFAFPVRMLQTGTVFGSPLSAIGSETLGGQAFLHGFVLAWAPITDLNGLDAIIGVLLCMFLAARPVADGSMMSTMTALGVISVIVVNPQYVNVSAVYLASALMMGVIALSTDPCALTGEDPLPDAIAISLLYAAMIALKSTCALFVVVHLPLVAMGLSLFYGDLRHGTRWALKTGLFTALFVSPWLLVHSEHYLAGLSVIGGDEIPHGSSAEALDLFSAKPLFYGNSIAHYTLVVSMMTIGAMVAISAARLSSRIERLSAYMTGVAAITGISSYLALLVILAPRLAGYDATLRYYTPFAIGILPMVLGSMAYHSAASVAFKAKALRVLLPVVVALIPICVFLPSLTARTGHLLRSGNQLAFAGLSGSTAYLAYNRNVLGAGMQKRVSAAQTSVPAGEPFLAWIEAPFYFDFGRNRVISVEPAGLATPWSSVPAVRYAIWEYRGYAVRPQEAYVAQLDHPGAHERLIAIRSLRLIDILELVAAKGEIIHDDGSIAVIRIPSFVQAK